MDEGEIRKVALAELTAIAPELDAAALHPDKALRSQVDLDSFDWLNFLIALHKRLSVDIPEKDYAKLVTLNDLVRYLQARLP
jgi:acyl carrier protein